MKSARTVIVLGKTHTVEETRDGSGWIEVLERDETGSVIAWYRRKAAPDAAAPMVPSPYVVIGGTAPADPAATDSGNGGSNV